MDVSGSVTNKNPLGFGLSRDNLTWLDEQFTATTKPGCFSSGNAEPCILELRA